MILFRIKDDEKVTEKKIKCNFLNTLTFVWTNVHGTNGQAIASKDNKFRGLLHGQRVGPTTH